MRCWFVRRRLVELLDIKPDEHVRTKLMAHVNACPRCANELKELRKTMQTVHSIIFSGRGNISCLRIISVFARISSPERWKRIYSQKRIRLKKSSITFSVAAISIL